MGESGEGWGWGEMGGGTTNLNTLFGVAMISRSINTKPIDKTTKLNKCPISNGENSKSMLLGPSTDTIITIFKGLAKFLLDTYTY